MFSTSDEAQELMISGKAHCCRPQKKLKKPLTYQALNGVI
jgi:hypothetical protein